MKETLIPFSTIFIWDDNHVDLFLQSVYVCVCVWLVLVVKFVWVFHLTTVK